MRLVGSIDEVCSYRATPAAVADPGGRATQCWVPYSYVKTIFYFLTLEEFYHKEILFLKSKISQEGENALNGKSHLFSYFTNVLVFRRPQTGAKIFDFYRAQSISL
jgi:hypothetical protein